jgi:hypothetical protein
VAGRLRSEAVDRHRRGKDRHAREESGELRRSLHFQAQGSPLPNTLNCTRRPRWYIHAGKPYGVTRAIWLDTLARAYCCRVALAFRCDRAISGTLSGRDSGRRSYGPAHRSC